MSRQKVTSIGERAAKHKKMMTYEKWLKKDACKKKSSAVAPDAMLKACVAPNATAPNSTDPDAMPKACPCTIFATS